MSYKRTDVGIKKVRFVSTARNVFVLDWNLRRLKTLSSVRNYILELTDDDDDDDDDDDCRFVKRITQDASTALRVPVRCEEVRFQR